MSQGGVLSGGDADAAIGPASSTDNAVVRFDGTTGKLLQNSSATLSDLGVLATSQLTLTTALAPSSGGLGHATFTAGDTVYASGATTIAKLGIGSTDQALIVSGGVPAWGSVNESGGGTGQTSYTKGDILYASDTDTLSKLAIPSYPGSTLVSDDNGIVAWSGDDVVSEYDELIGNISGKWKSQTDGVVSIDIIQDGAHPGVWTAQGSTAGQGGSIYKSGDLGEDSMTFGGGYTRFDFLVKVNELATAGEDYDCWVGIFKNSVFVSEIGTDGIAFEYQRSNSTNWTGVTRASSTSTVASGGTDVAVTNSWTHLRIDINADASEVTFYVDGVIIGTSSTNIPTAMINPGIKFEKTAGTAARNLSIDAYRYYVKLTSSRWS